MSQARDQDSGLIWPDPASLAAIAEARHGDPFSILGPHQGMVRAHLPGLRRLWLVEPGHDPVEMQRHPQHGAILAGRRRGQGAYRLRAEQEDGRVADFEDPYRFGPVLGQVDEHLIGEGNHLDLWQVLGAHPRVHQGVEGTHFAVWAPNAARVSVVGDFNGWDGRCHPMRRLGWAGIWEIFLPGVAEGAVYKYELVAADGRLLPLKADPVGFGSEHAPQTGSVVRRAGGRAWQDAGWMAQRARRNSVDAPISVYEVHIGSWRRVAEGEGGGAAGRPLSYAELADALVEYVEWMGFTHIELLPITEHPFDGSWGYQPVGLFAPTIRHGTPEEFAALVDAAHRRGLGVLLDWVPGHFPTDAHGLAQFDGTALYEHADPREGFHHDWNTLIFNYGRTEVANYLSANALYWLQEYHLDGLRIDAVASMLYRDYSRREGEWIPNRQGGRENLEAIALLQRVNRLSYGQCPGIMTVAEESTAFPGVSRPVDQGGLGFGFKWNMGWMNDTLSYIQKDPIHRRHHHNQLTFGLTYAWSENFVLPISHDEVVHGKGSMLGKMPGTGEQKFANLRAYYSFMWMHPGKKLLFMGQEFAQGREWSHSRSLDWHQADEQAHRGVQLLVRDLNRLYRDNPALHRHDCRPQGFAWLDADDADHSILAFQRRGDAGDSPIVVVINFTPVPREGYRLGFPEGGLWDEILNSDAAIYGGQNRGNGGLVRTEPIPAQGQGNSASVFLPPLSAVVFRRAEPALKTGEQNAAKT